MNVLIINGHPRSNSLSSAFATAYAHGAKQAGAQVQLINTAKLEFEHDVTEQHSQLQYTERDIADARALILWCNHLVLIYPTWWGTVPGTLKAFIDRVFVAGFAFEETEAGTGYLPLLSGRSAQVITTMDTPRMIYQLIYRAPGHNAIRRSILEFCGFLVTSITSFGPVKKSDQSLRESWIKRVEKEGLKLQAGTVPAWMQSIVKLKAWIQALRLQFYPMTFIAYAAGTFAAQQSGYGFDPLIFWLGYVWLFLVEVSTVLSNDYFDFESDRQNRSFGPFTGGSRVLVNGQLSFQQVGRGIFFTLFSSFAVLALLYFLIPGPLSTVAMTCGILLILALGYTVPPLKLSHRGLGEVTVGITHSFAVILCGYLFQGGILSDPIPWFISLPLFLAVLPSITLSGLPDFDADKAASKKTLAVQLGKKGAARLAFLFTIMSAGSVLIFDLFNILPGIFTGIIFGVLPHAVLLSVLLWRYIINKNPAVRIDGLMVASLTYLMWFAVVPLVNLY